MQDNTTTVTTRQKRANALASALKSQQDIHSFEEGVDEFGRFLTVSPKRANGKSLSFQIDIADRELANLCTWNLNSAGQVEGRIIVDAHGRPSTKGSLEKVLLCNLVSGCNTNNQDVIFKDENKLNLRRSNLTVIDTLFFLSDEIGKYVKILNRIPKSSEFWTMLIDLVDYEKIKDKKCILTVGTTVVGDFPVLNEKGNIEVSRVTLINYLSGAEKSNHMVQFLDENRLNFRRHNIVVHEKNKYERVMHPLLGKEMMALHITGLKYNVNTFFVDEEMVPELSKQMWATRFFRDEAVDAVCNDFRFVDVIVDGEVTQEKKATAESLKRFIIKDHPELSLKTIGSIVDFRLCNFHPNVVKEKKEVRVKKVKTAEEKAAAPKKVKKAAAPKKVKKARKPKKVAEVAETTV